jgi:methionyl-tRNA formyltransferase
VLRRPRRPASVPAKAPTLYGTNAARDERPGHEEFPLVRIAVLTLESLVSAVAVRRFVLAERERIVLVGLSDPFRPLAGGAFGQVARRLRQSGPRLLPYLALNFTLPRLTPKGADLARTPLATLSRRLDLESVVVSDVNGPAFRERLAESGADLLVTFHFDQILGGDTLAAAPRGGLNVHPSLLPKHRGPTPTIHALLDPEPAFGVTVHRLATRIDAGEVLAQVAVDLPPGATALGAARALHDAGAELLREVLARGLHELPPSPRVVETLPYQSFPSSEEMSRLARLGRRAADWRDLRAAFATAI